MNYTLRELTVAAAAREIRDGDKVFVGMIFERLLQDGNTWYRPGWGPEYCCLTNAEYVAIFHEGIYKHSRALAHF